MVTPEVNGLPARDRIVILYAKDPGCGGHAGKGIAVRHWRSKVHRHQFTRLVVVVGLALEELKRVNLTPAIRFASFWTDKMRLVGHRQVVPGVNRRGFIGLLLER